MEQSRRGFFKSLLGAAALGATAEMTITKQVLADPVLNKYAQTVQMQKHLYGFHRELVEKAEVLGISRAGLICPGFLVRDFPSLTASLSPEIREKHDISLVAAARRHQYILDQSDELLGFMMDNYEPPSKDPHEYEHQHQLVRDLFTKDLQIDVLSEEGLRTACEAIVPIAVAKHMIATERLPLDTQKMPQLDRFAAMYKDLIMR